MPSKCYEACIVNGKVAGCYVVQSGDTLAKVAAFCRVPEAQILFLNRPELDGSRLLKPKQKIIILQ